MYEIRIPDPETLKDNPWWKSGGEILYYEIAVGPFSYDEEGCVRPALPKSLKQAFDTGIGHKWHRYSDTKNCYIRVPSWVCFEIMRMAQLIKHFETCPMEFENIPDEDFVLIKKPIDPKQNNIFEEGCFYECGGYYIVDKSRFNIETAPVYSESWLFDFYKQFESSAIPYNEEFLMKSELALLPSDEYDMDDMIYVGEQNPEEELNEGEGFYDDSSDEEGEDWKN